MRELEIGIDEAGYGPLLGPLCVSGVASTKLFHESIRDSKMIYRLGGQAALLRRCRYYYQGSLNDLFVHSAEQFSREPWFFGKRPDLDLGMIELNDPETHVQIRAMGVRKFNKMVEHGFNKAEILLSLIEDILGYFLDRLRQRTVLRIHIDRLGGRKDYSGILSNWGMDIDDARVEDQRSHYQGQWRRHSCTVTFLVQGDEQRHLIAAASCFAKLQRELLMKSFNGWWSQKKPGLEPTAGYYVDGKRFLKTIEDLMLSHNIHPSLLQRSL